MFLCMAYNMVYIESMEHATCCINEKLEVQVYSALVELEELHLISFLLGLRFGEVEQ